MSYPTKAQYIPVETRNTGIYDFLEEMATEQLIDINSTIKPWSRQTIANHLAQLDARRENLNPRQAKELDFYLEEYLPEFTLPSGSEHKPGWIKYHYRDSLFNFTLKPIFGGQYWINGNGSTTHTWNGGQAHATVGDHWGFWASLRDNHEPDRITREEYLNRRRGATNFKEGTDYSEMKGGITYSWKWGRIGVMKEHAQWGSNYHGANIFSGRTPSFAKIDLYIHPVDWFEFNYFHGWLVSMEVDSARSYYTATSYGTSYREVYHKKFIAANLFTFKPFKQTRISVGNSIVYSDLDVHPAYLIPILFYKSVDHTLNSETDNQNSQMFINVSTRLVKRLHLYGSLFLDELSIGRMFEPEEHTNFYSFKAGAKVYNLGLRNTWFNAEYTRTNPLTFRHPRPTITFGSNRYNLGHYLLDNAEEIWLAAGYRPVRGLSLSAHFTYARKGPDYTDLATQRRGRPFMESVEWEKREVGFKARYEIISGGYLLMEYVHSNISGDAMPEYTHPLWQGKVETFSIGLNYGF